MATSKIKVDIITTQDLGYSQNVETKVNTKAASICVRALMQNWRQGTVACKGRSDVAFSNKKPWKQKGTGRARAGSKRSPIWRSGGVAFGPQQRVRTLKAIKKVKANVISSLFENLAANERILKLHWALEVDKPKTALAFKALKEANLAQKKVNLFVAPSDIHVQASFANLPNVRLMFFDECNVYDLANAEYLVCLEKDANLLKEMVSKWI